MTLPKVFVASSSEGMDVVGAVHKLLQRALSGTADVRPWPGEFHLTKAYIESLERLLDTSDFAVMVLTPDDRTASREAERASPRDNVVCLNSDCSLGDWVASAVFSSSGAILI